MDDAFYNWLVDMHERELISRFELYDATVNERSALRLFRDFLMDEREATIEFVRTEVRELIKLRLNHEGTARPVSEEGESDD